MKTNWDDRRENIRNLYLDLENPRVPKYIKDQKDIKEIRNYLLQKEGVLKIAKNIATNGYHHSAVAITCEEEGKLVVLDGNRRLAACQFLLDPSLAPTVKEKKEFEALSKSLDKEQFEKVKITIAPSRKAAEKEIWDIHVNPLLKPWEVLQKLRMYRNLINEGEYTVEQASTEYGLTEGKFKAELAKLFFYEEILKRKPNSETILLNSGFNKITRLLLSKNGKKYLDYTVEPAGDIELNDKLNYEDNLNKLIPYIIEPKRVEAQASQQWIEENVFSVIDSKRFPRKEKVKGEHEKEPISAQNKSENKEKVKGPPRCFVIMPLAGLDSVYEIVKSAWKEVFGEGAKIFHQGEDGRKGGKTLMDDKILKNIRTSTAVVGILSMGTKEQELFNLVPTEKHEAIFKKAFPFNINVALEVGYALRSAGPSSPDQLRDFFFIADDSTENSTFKFLTKHCFDLGHRDITPYTEKDLDKLKIKLIEHFTHFKEENKL